MWIARLLLLASFALSSGAAAAQDTPRPPSAPAPPRADGGWGRPPFSEPELFARPRLPQGPILPYNPGFDDAARDRGARAQGSTFLYRGEPRPRVRIAPFRWPRGRYYAERPAGSVLDTALILRNYRIGARERRRFGFADPGAGEAWLRVGDDALRVRLADREILESVRGAYY